MIFPLVLKSIIFRLIQIILFSAMGLGFYWRWSNRGRKAEWKEEHRLRSRIEGEGLRKLPERIKAISEGKEDPWIEEKEELLKLLDEKRKKSLKKDIQKERFRFRDYLKEAAEEPDPLEELKAQVKEQKEDSEV